MRGEFDSKVIIPSKGFRNPPIDKSPRCCDLKLISGDDYEFLVHSKLFSDKSDFFGGMLSMDLCEKQTGVCDLQCIDGETLKSVCLFVYGLSHAFRDNEYFPLLIAANFLMLKDLESFCAAKLTRNPFLALEHPMFEEALEHDNALVVDQILRLALELDDDSRILELFDRLSSSQAKQKFFRTVLRKVRSDIQKITILDGDKNRWLTYTGSFHYGCFRTCLRNIPNDVESVTALNDSFWYSRDASVYRLGVDKAFFTEKSKDHRVESNPLLTRYGQYICWTVDNRQGFTILKDGVEYHHKMRTPYVIKTLATADTKNYENFIIAAKQYHRLHLLYLDSIYNQKTQFRRILCPLSRIDCIAVLNDIIYMVGSTNAGTLSGTLYEFRERKLKPLAERLRLHRPEKLIPFNNRLYLIVNGQPGIEVYEPSLNLWQIDSFPEMENFRGFFTQE